jgi:hypothetical protein
MEARAKTRVGFIRLSRFEQGIYPREPSAMSAAVAKKLFVLYLLNTLYP